MDGSLGGLAYVETPDFVFEEFFFVFLGPFPPQNGAFSVFPSPLPRIGQSLYRSPLVEAAVLS